MHTNSAHDEDFSANIKCVLCSVLSIMLKTVCVNFALSFYSNLSRVWHFTCKLNTQNAIEFFGKFDGNESEGKWSDSTKIAIKYYLTRCDNWLLLFGPSDDEDAAKEFNKRQKWKVRWVNSENKIRIAHRSTNRNRSDGDSQSFTEISINKVEFVVEKLPQWIQHKTDPDELKIL